MNCQNKISILFFGDVIGKPGRRVIASYLADNPGIADIVVANAENAAHGFGTTEGNLEEMRQAGVSAFTGGNHTFDRKEIYDFIERQQNVIRPANYPEGTPGQGSCLVELKNGKKLGIVNVLGRVFMEPLESPFLVAERLVAELAKETNIILVDVHAEATAEKVAVGWYLNGKASAVVGTHTHVPTADERILDGGTAYITDVGCCGPLNGVIGMDKENVFKRMIKQLPARFEVAPGVAQLNGVLIEVDSDSGKALSIRRIRFIESEDTVESEQKLELNVSTPVSQ